MSVCQCSVSAIAVASTDARAYSKIKGFDPVCQCVSAFFYFEKPRLKTGAKTT